MRINKQTDNTTVKGELGIISDESYRKVQKKYIIRLKKDEDINMRCYLRSDEDQEQQEGDVCVGDGTKAVRDGAGTTLMKRLKFWLFHTNTTVAEINGT